MTKTEICNRALAVLGHDRTISDFDGTTEGVYNDMSEEAVRCRQFFDSALKNCIAEHDWDFLAVERNLGTLHPDEFGWVRIVLQPDALRVVLVSDAEGKPFRIRRNRDAVDAQTHGDFARLRYISDDIDIETLPHSFQEAVIYQLAYLISGPMFGDAKKSEGYMNLARMKLSDALSKETDETAYRGATENRFINARR